jgi:hypothetical protein
MGGLQSTNASNFNLDIENFKIARSWPLLWNEECKNRMSQISKNSSCSIPYPNLTLNFSINSNFTLHAHAQKVYNIQTMDHMTNFC